MMVSIEVILRDETAPKSHGVAICGRWLDAIIEDGKVDREKLAAAIPRQVIDQLADGFEKAGPETIVMKHTGINTGPALPSPMEALEIAIDAAQRMLDKTETRATIILELDRDGWADVMIDKSPIPVEMLPYRHAFKLHGATVQLRKN